uniref:Cytochrome c oxidase subunit 2 n=1 Tax=Brachycybe lecontii TaxID=1176341 RepID=S4T1L1_BRALC|nr:cytochrome c oxidase subunit II [Brachycybe lecontii]AFR77038.1 cytochrome c oxidase subunit II [Brachycybe lecontii]
MTTWSDIMFQDSASPLMDQLIFFNDHLMMIMIMIMSLVTYSFYMLITNSMKNRFIYESQEVEILWTIFPLLALVFIIVPSLQLLYMLDESNMPSITLKTTGHQWYWKYEYSDFNTIEFDSYMSQFENLSSFRLLDVDNRTILPTNIQIRILLTSSDVLHAWAIPSMGIKSDAVPGRLNQILLLINQSGLWFGQCSEICGANHSFMPIVLETISPMKFLHWIKNSM